jgi:hypothetical protein
MVFNPMCYPQTDRETLKEKLLNQKNLLSLDQIESLFLLDCHQQKPINQNFKVLIY